MDSLKDILFTFNYNQLKDLWLQHYNWSKDNERISGSPKWFDDPSTINVIGIRCNSENDFNNKKYNDYLMIIYNTPSNNFDYQLIECTVDPNRAIDHIAHLRQGIWNSYVIRPHKFASRYFEQIDKTIPRYAICQDLNKVEIIRTNGAGVMISTDRGMYGINIHDSGGYIDSSAGCTVIKSDDDYLNRYLPYLFDLEKNIYVPVNHSNISYCLINESNLNQYIQLVYSKTEIDTQ